MKAAMWNTTLFKSYKASFFIAFFILFGFIGKAQDFACSVVTENIASDICPSFLHSMDEQGPFI
ncbi:MAG: hypothetical protein KI786_15855 [Mameliella sp.]|nr:hypothetical protein [Phaeodactylibacter sp.]NRA49344.1 hypothetical protein [Phaeodactylibacter sp.]